MASVVVVGNPKPQSRTLDAATKIASRIDGNAPDVVIDLVDLGPGLLGWGDEAVAAAVAQVREADWVVVASPTYKATYTGLLKLFLDQFDAGSLGGAGGKFNINVQPLIPANATVDFKLSGELDRYFWSVRVNNVFNALYYDYAIASAITARRRFVATPFRVRRYATKAGTRAIRQSRNPKAVAGKTASRAARRTTTDVTVPRPLRGSPAVPAVEPGRAGGTMCGTRPPRR